MELGLHKTMVFERFRVEGPSCRRRPGCTDHTLTNYPTMGFKYPKSKTHQILYLPRVRNFVSAKANGGDAETEDRFSAFATSRVQF